MNTGIKLDGRTANKSDSEMRRAFLRHSDKLRTGSRSSGLGRALGVGDPRHSSYLLVWNSSRDGRVEEAVRVARFVPETKLQEADAVETRRTDGSTVAIYFVWRRQPRGGRTLLLRCWRCERPRRALYGAKVSDNGRYYVPRKADWECRTCSQLRYSSEGGYLRPSKQYRAFGNFPRPDLWLPYVFTSPQKAVEAGLCAYRGLNTDKSEP